MDLRHYRGFLASEDTLRVYIKGELVFSSKKERLLPLMEYLREASTRLEKAVIYDKVLGNAAALLSVLANAAEVASPLGSELAARTLEGYGISYTFDKVVPYIMRDDGKGMCPMEALSLGKKPEEFYQVLRAMAEKSPEAG